MSKVSRTYIMDLSDGPILSKMLKFALPLMFSGILQLLFNAADIIVIGKFAGDTSLAAVGATTALINLIINLFIGTSIGTNVLCANYIGAGRTKDVSETVHTSIAISIILGLFLGVFGFFVSPLLLGFMQTPEEVLVLSSVYLKIYFLGLPALMIYNFGAAVLRSVGDTAHPLIFLLISGAVNVGLNLLFVISFSMDVAGVALATIISEYISAALIIMLLIRSDSYIRLDLKHLRINGGKLKRIMKIGIPAGISGTVFSISNVIIQADINYFGANVIAGNSAATSLDSFVFASMDAFYQADISFTGQSLGAGRIRRIMKIFVVNVIIEIILAAVLGTLLVQFSAPLLSIYTNSQAVIEAGAQRIAIMSIGYAACGVMDTLSGSLRGMGSSVFPTIASILFICVFRIIYLGIALPAQNFSNVDTIYWSYPISWLIADIAMLTAFLIFYKKKRDLYGANAG